MRMMQGESRLSLSSKGQVRSDRCDKLPSNSQKRRGAKPEKMPYVYLKGEKVKAPNTRLLLEAFDGFSRGGRRCRLCIIEGVSASFSGLNATLCVCRFAGDAMNSAGTGADLQLKAV